MKCHIGKINQKLRICNLDNNVCTKPARPEDIY